MNKINDKPEKSEEDSLGDENSNKLNQNQNDKLYKDLLDKIKNTPIVANRLDYYPHAIPLGSFCFAISFILYGFFECKVHNSEDNILYIVFFFFGGLGQLTAGIFEFIKSRTYPATLYITYGLYCLSFFFAIKNKFKCDINNDVGNNNCYFNEEAEKIYFGSWAFIGAPFIIYSLRINIFYTIQNIAIVAFFVLKGIGAGKDSEALTKITPGILELIAGFSSLYICYGQILNKNFGTTILPFIPLKKDNDVDDFVIKKDE